MGLAESDSLTGLALGDEDVTTIGPADGLTLCASLGTAEGFTLGAVVGLSLGISKGDALGL